MLEIKFALHKNDPGQRRRCFCGFLFCFIWYWSWLLCMGADFLCGSVAAFLSHFRMKVLVKTIIKWTCVNISGSWSMKKEGEGSQPDSDSSQCVLIQQRAQVPYCNQVNEMNEVVQDRRMQYGSGTQTFSPCDPRAVNSLAIQMCQWWHNVIMLLLTFPGCWAFTFF